MGDGKRPFAVIGKGKIKSAQTEERDESDHHRELAEESARLEGEKRKRQAATDKLTALLFGVEEQIDVVHGRMWPWFVRPGENGEPAAMHVSDFFDVERNQHRKDLTSSIAVDRFTDCYSDADAERRHHVALRRRLLNANGIRYVVLHRGPGGSLLDAAAQLAAQGA